MKRPHAALFALVLLAAPAGAFDLGFVPGRTSLTLADAPPPERCGDCHEREYAEWHDSRHRAAWTNERMQAGFVADPAPFCVPCHAPMAEQGAQIAANLDWYRARDPRNSSPSVFAPKQPEPAAADGISCAVCHVRDGVILAPEVSGAAPHRVRAVPELRDPSFCASCHEFGMPEERNGELFFTDTPMQSTWSEWNAWSAAGGSGTCLSCHGAHELGGAADVERLAAAVSLTVEPDGRGAWIEVQSQGVGHSFPTGDLFRHMVLQVDRGDGYEEIARFGREFEVVTEADGPHKRLGADTSLRPGVPVRIRVDRARKLQARLVYWYTRPDEPLSAEQMSVVIATRSIPADIPPFR